VAGFPLPATVTIRRRAKILYYYSGICRLGTFIARAAT
jgi:hypothetical protein